MSISWSVYFVSPISDLGYRVFCWGPWSSSWVLCTVRDKGWVLLFYKYSVWPTAFAENAAFSPIVLLSSLLKIMCLLEHGLVCWSSVLLHWWMSQLLFHYNAVFNYSFEVELKILGGTTSCRLLFILCLLYFQVKLRLLLTFILNNCAEIQTVLVFSL